MNQSVRPQRLVHRGVVDAAAFYFGAPPGTDGARHRVLALWVPGAVIYRIGDGLLLRLPTPRRVVCADSPGLPLTRQGDFLTAAPLHPKEIAALAPPGGSAVLVRGGVALVQIVSGDQTEDPATWLDLHGYAAIPVESLGQSPAVPQVLAEPVPFDGRERFGNIPAADPARRQIIEDLRNAPGRASAKPGDSAGAGTPAFPAVGRFLGQAFGWLFTLLFPERTRAARNATGASTSSARRESNSPLSNRDTPWEAMQRLTARFLLLTGLSGIVGRRQAQYLNKMMNLFERGELNDALRYAIPLKSSPDDNPAPPALGVPTPRDDLQLTLRPETGQGTGIGVSEDLLGELRSLYRRAITKLEAEGRVEEAAFILADLLHEYEEAVALLERHKRLRLAAELAEGHALPPGLIVRLWFLAGDTDRAVQIARRNGAFADAVLRLERTDKERANVLRGLWARERARAGDYAAAVEIIWPLESAREIAGEWIRRASEGGGAVGGRMLARRLSLEDGEEIRNQAIALLEEKNAERAAERLAFAEMLPSLAGCASARPLARRAVRTLWGDANAGWINITPPGFREILRVADDGALRADVLPLPQTVRKTLSQQGGKTLEIAVAADDTGSLAIYDAAYLPNGQCLVALGEVGTRLLSRDGRTIVHFDQPAHRLVVSNTGNHAIGLARRGTVWRLARFDLVTRRGVTWTDAALCAFAPDYDGSLWFVSIENDLLAIDATSEGFDALWRMPNIEGTVAAISRTATDCSLLIRAQGETDPFGKPTDPWVSWERWHYVLPALTLRDRGAIEITGAANGNEVVAVSAAGVVGEVHRFTPEHGGSYLVLAKTPRPDDRKDNKMSLSVPGDTALFCEVTDYSMLVVTGDDTGSTCQLFSVSNTFASPSVCIILAGSTRVVSRMTTETATLCDDKGRLIVLSLTDGTLLRNLRLS
ncbi:MAG: hypothetical protein H7145_17640 [Akkermansiaceae bacterium]|nr:hypothetical protein [Armatimonadota bacterium]